MKRSPSRYTTTPKRDDNSNFCSHLLSAIDLQCHVFPYEKLLLNVRLSVNGIFDDVISDVYSPLLQNRWPDSVVVRASDV